MFFVRGIRHLGLVCTCIALRLAGTIETCPAAERLRLVPIGNYQDGRLLSPAHENPPRLEMLRDGTFIFATRAGTESLLYAYARDKETGKLELRSTLPKSAAASPEILGTTPDSRFAFVNSAPGLLSFAIDGNTGGLTQHQTLANLKDGIVGLRYIQLLCISPDGKSIYVAGHRDKSLVCLRRDPVTGNAQFEECLQSAKTGQAEPGTSIVLTKPLKDARRVEGIGAIYAMACSPDGAHVIVASNPPGPALTVFARDPHNGRLAQIQTLDDPRPVSNNIRRVHSIAFHPDGSHVVVCSVLGGISLLERDSETGELTFIEAYLDDGELPEFRPKLYTTEGLKNTSKVIWSPDGRMVFAASYGDNAIVGFHFDQKAKHLNPSVCIRPQDGIEGLMGVNTLCISPDGRFLYSGSRDDTVTAFEIKP